MILRPELSFIAFVHLTTRISNEAYRQLHVLVPWRSEHFLKSVMTAPARKGYL